MVDPVLPVAGAVPAAVSPAAELVVVAPAAPPAVVATPEPVAGPAVSEPSPVVPEPVAPAAVPAPVTEPPATEVPEPELGLLRKFDAEKKEEAKAPEPKADAPKPVEAKAAEVKPGEQPPPAPVEYKFEMPEGFKADGPKMEMFTGILGEGHVAPELGQKLVNLHAEAMTEYANFLRAEQWKTFHETRAEWRKEAMADPEIGGAGYQTAMGAIARMRDLLVPASEMAAFDKFLADTGADDHPQMLKMLHRAARWLDEPQAGDVPANPKPPPSNGRNPNRSRSAILYDNTPSLKR